jgi:hypothetical protein
MKTVENLLNMNPMVATTDVATIDQPASLPVVKQEVELSADQTLAKDTIREIVETSRTVFDSLVDLAKESESPRAFEVASTFMKNLGEMAVQLYNLDKAEHIEQNIVPPNQNNTQVNNTVFVGSSEQLLDYLKQNRGQN